MLHPSIIYEDNHLLIVQKPPGFLAQPDGSPRPDILAWAEKYLAQNKPGRAFVGLVHRLDRVVGGVMALAKTSKAAARLSLQFKERTIEKKYLALVPEAPPTPSGHLEQNLVRVGAFTHLANPGEKGTLAILSWEIHQFPPPYTLLGINLITGFKHQIRAQLANMGLPLVGDAKYGSHLPPPIGQIKGIGLWAESLALDHPTRPERMVFKGHCPWAFENNQG